MMLNDVECKKMQKESLLVLGVGVRNSDFLETSTVS